MIDKAELVELLRRARRSNIEFYGPERALREKTLTLWDGNNTGLDGATVDLLIQSLERELALEGR